MPRHQITRLRHDIRRRTLTVAGIAQLSPRMRRIDFTCPELGDFVSASFDDHIKLFFTPDGPPAEGERPVMRDFTPRRFDVEAGTLTIDFALHDAGPATAWAAAAGVGDTLHIGGPRGSAVIPDDFDWYLLVGDATSLPAIGRRLEELRAGVPVATFVLVDTADEAQQPATQADWTPHWVVRRPNTDSGAEDAATLLAALEGYALPPGEGFVWIAADSTTARAVRRHVVETLGHPREWTKAAGYWQAGQADAHERIED